MSASVIVLDLDLTLLCTDYEDGTTPYQPRRMPGDRTYPLVRASHMYSFHMFDPSCQRDCTMYGCFRPGYRHFLQWARTRFDYVVVWSAGRRAYVHELVTKIWKGLPQPDLVMTFNDLGLSGDVYTKPLAKVAKLLGVTTERMLLVDDNPQVSVDNPDNAVLMPEYDPKVEDDSLYQLMDLLEDRAIGQAPTYSTLGLRNALRAEPVVTKTHHQLVV